MDLQSIISLIISFSMVAVLSVLLERIFNLVNKEQCRPSSPLKRNKKAPQLSQFIKRSSAIGLRYLEIFLVAIVGIGLDHIIRKGMNEVSMTLIVPVLMIFIPVSFIIVTTCVPKSSRSFFYPKIHEWIISFISILFGVFWIILLFV